MRAFWLLVWLLVPACAAEAAPLEEAAGAPEAQETVVPVTPVVEKEMDPTLLAGVSYLVRSGRGGVGEAGATPAVVRVGTRDEALVREEGRAAVAEYLAAYQTGDRAALDGLTVGTPPPAAAAVEAEFQILDFTLEEPTLRLLPADLLPDLAALPAGYYPVPEQDAGLEGAIVEGFLVAAYTPARVTFSLFGTRQVWDGDLIALWQPGAAWRVLPWGVMSAGAARVTLEHEAGTVTLDGIATFTDHALAVTTQEAQPPVYVGEAAAAVGVLTDVREGRGVARLPALPPDAERVTLRVKIGFGSRAALHEVAVALVGGDG